jgi:hypothetical protein
MTRRAYLRRRRPILTVLALLLVLAVPSAASAEDGPPLWSRMVGYDQHARTQFAKYAQPARPHHKVTVRVGETSVRTRISAPPGKSPVRIGIYVDGGLVHGVYGTGTTCGVDFPVHGLLVRVDGCHTAAGVFNVTVANATGKPHRVTVWMQRSG